MATDTAYVYDGLAISFLEKKVLSVIWFDVTQHSSANTFNWKQKYKEFR